MDTSEHHLLILKGKPFYIPFSFKSLTDCPQIFRILFNEKKYEVQSDVSESVFQSFLDFWVKDVKPDINIDNYYEFCLLNQEFQYQSFENFLNSKEDILNEYKRNLIKLKDKSTDDKFLIEQKISRNLDIYLIKYQEEMMSLPIQQLYRLFSNSSLTLENPDYAYQSIMSRYNETNDSEIFILLPFLDGKKLGKENLEECFQKKEEHGNFLPKFDFSSFNDSLNQKDVKISELENRLEIQSNKINQLFNLVMDDQYTANLSHFFLPIDKNWTQININEFTFSDDANKYTLKVSSTWEDSVDCSIIKLLNGKNELEGGGVWATKYCDKGSIEVIFGNNPVCVNLISFTTRDGFYQEAPSSFDILARNGSDEFVLLKSFSVFTYGKNEKRFFKFANSKSYTSYKLNFNHCSYSDKIGRCYGLAEFNIGQIIL